MRIAVGYLLFASLGFGQTAGEAILSGKITDSVTQQPIEGAQLSINKFTATSDVSGSYSLKVRPRDASDVLQIIKSGYARNEVMVRLIPGVSEVRDFQLSHTAAISGHVADRDSGLPLSGFYIRADPADHIGPGSMVGPSAADGSFSIPNLTPGNYYLEMNPPARAQVSSGDKKPVESGYARSWYPGAPRRDMGVPVTVSAGENRRIEVRVQKRELRHIKGALEAPEGKEGVGIFISLRGPSGFTEGEVSKAGAFQIDGLEPGSYTLLASTRTVAGQGHLFGNREVELTNRDLDDVRLNLRPGVTLRAIVSMAEKDADLPSGIEFTTIGLDGWGPELGASTKSDPLRVADLPPGKLWPALRTPAGIVVASLSYGGHPVLPSTSIDVQSAESAVTFVLTSRVGQVTGTVRDDDRKPVRGATVWLLPPSLPDTVDKFFFFSSGGGGLTTSDDHGGFLFNGLAPGSYKAIALTGEDRHTHDLLFIRDLLRSVDAVTVEPGQTATIDIRAR